MKKGYLISIITMLIIGFAAVATNLFINGTINFGFNNTDFNNGVVFTYKDTYNGEADISEDGKTINFTSVKLENVDQKAILRYDVANKSQQYDASVTISCDFEDDSKQYSEWLKIGQDLTSPFKLKAGETQKGTLTVTLIKPYNEALETPVDIKCELKATPGSRNEKGEYVEVEHNYEEVLLQGADPVLEGVQVEAMAIDADTPKKLVPVTISETGEVKKADITQKWYDYENKEWANAVILKDGVDEPVDNAIISENSIESYFVWIPKYKYKLWNVGTNDPVHNGPFEIEIEFGTEDTIDNEDECIAPNESGEIGHCANGKWMTHPAFTSFDVNGFWVGKFETGYKDAATEEDARQDTVETNHIIIKPNVYSWRNISIQNIITVANEYAINLDSHMMKNTEWGAVAYLSHSKYGLNNEVAQNTNSQFKTGYAKSDNGSSTYNSSDGVKASTTGNITGIYDMSGGSWERMAAFKDVSTIETLLGNNKYTEQEIKKYFDIYDKTSISTQHDDCILGDATGELGPFSGNKSSWYNESADFFKSDTQWLLRGGGYNDTDAGQFYFHTGYQGFEYRHSYRLVLSPQ